MFNVSSFRLRRSLFASVPVSFPKGRGKSCAELNFARERRRSPPPMFGLFYVKRLNESDFAGLEVECENVASEEVKAEDAVN